MTLEQAQAAYGALPPKGQARFLADLAHDVTFWTRYAYPGAEGPAGDTERLRGSNELLHRLTEQLRDLLAQDRGRYPDDVFVTILFERARPAGCEERLTGVFQELFDAYRR